ncbi:hypothetical protein GCM10011494_24770 [Novosphingobium endophyticum]|uniref:Transposase n=1 Tax=Novosphingobium endophyticum TaxID=1955250 RepID=A0A916TTK7_9SPHN|nr:hypothetical protein GCM10011494_24770 [Novosphingobium endophyticum]
MHFCRFGAKSHGFTARVTSAAQLLANNECARSLAVQGTGFTGSGPATKAGQPLHAGVRRRPGAGAGRAGDSTVRGALFEAAHVLMTRVAKWSKIKAWAMNIAKRRGAKRAKVALARKLGIILHRMWVDETDFVYGQPA